MKENSLKNRTLVQLEDEYYIINDDKINPGDWFYCSDKTNYAHIFKCIGLTENTHLQVANYTFNVFGANCYAEAKEYPYGDWDICYSHKIIASTNNDLDDVELLNFESADSFND